MQRSCQQARAMLRNAIFYLYLTYSLLVITENITINHTFSKSRFLRLHLLQKYGSNFNHCDVIWLQIYQIL